MGRRLRRCNVHIGALDLGNAFRIGANEHADELPTRLLMLGASMPHALCRALISVRMHAFIARSDVPQLSLERQSPPQR